MEEYMNTRFAFVFALFSLFLVACSDKSAQAPVDAPLPKVSVVAASMASVVSSREYVAITEPKEDVTIQSRVSGYLVKQHVSDGARVKKGDLLFELDKDTLEAEVSKANAMLAADQAALDETTRNYGRGKELIGKGSISQSQMDQLLSKKLQAEAAIKSSNAALKSATLNLNYASIYAPIDGVLSQAGASLGDSITPSTTLASLVLVDPMYVSFQVSEREMMEFREKRQAEMAETGVELKSIAKLKFSTGTIYDQVGEFNFLDNRVDTTTGTIKVRAEFPNKDSFLLPGQHTTIIVESGEPRDVLVIPQKAVQEDQAGLFVLVLGSDQVVEKRTVSTGTNEGTNIIVQSGLKEGEQVIVDGLQKVRIGGKAEGSIAQMPHSN
jgi:membrane fusion protein (multidrug efflux system)